MTPRRRIGIVGYGTAGQAAALALVQRGHAVTVFERVAQPGPVGAGFLLQPTGLQALWRLGLLQTICAHGAAVHRLYGDTLQQRTVMDMRYAQLDTRLHGIGLQRGALFEVLDAALQGHIDLHADHPIDAIDVDAGRLRYRGGRWHGPFDLLIVADGAASALREAVSPCRIQRPYPWGALWCLLPEADWPWRDELRQRYRLARNMVGFLPVGTAPGSAVRKLSFFWSLPIKDMDAWKAAGPQAWLDELRRLWPQAWEQLGDGFDVGCLARAAYRDAIPQRWWRGRAVLLGDAAHAMSPQLGQGVNMALMDAVALADALEEDSTLDAVLHACTTQRARHLAAYHRWSRWLTPIFQSEQDLLARVRDLAFHPLGRLPGGRGHMLRVLTGTQQGWWGRYALDPVFIRAFEPLRKPPPQSMN